MRYRIDERIREEDSTLKEKLVVPGSNKLTPRLALVRKIYLQNSPPRSYPRLKGVELDPGNEAQKGGLVSSTAAPLFSKEDFEKCT